MERIPADGVMTLWCNHTLAVLAKRYIKEAEK